MEITMENKTEAIELEKHIGGTYESLYSNYF